MYLISCHVDNFGKLQDYSLDFSEGLNQFCYENGAGKSTLAIFIRVMFYGFEGDSKRDELANERKRYMPWQGGIYGGNICFFTHGKRYRLSRQFGVKSSNDIFELRDLDTNLISTDYTENIGMELFHINSESFMHSVFIGQSDCVTKTTDNINARIGNPSENNNDISRFELADASLTEILNELTPNRKTGELSRLKEQIAQLKYDIKSMENIETELKQLDLELASCEEEITAIHADRNDIDLKYDKVNKYAKAQGDRKVYEKLLKDVEDARRDLNAARKCFGEQVPDSLELKQAVADAKDYASVSANYDGEELTQEDREEYDRVVEKYPGGVPALSEVNELIEDIEKYNEEMDTASKMRLSIKEKSTLDELSRVFDSSENPKADLNRLGYNHGKIKMLEDELPAKEEKLRGLKETKPIDKKAFPYMAVMGAVVLIMGIAFTLITLLFGSDLDIAKALNMSNTLTAIVGIGISVVGIAVLIAGLISFFRKVSRNSEEKLAANNAIAELELSVSKDLDSIASLRKEEKDYLLKHGYECDDSMVEETLQLIYDMAVEYTRLKEKHEAVKSEVDEDFLKRCEAQFQSFCRNFNLYCNKDRLVFLNEIKNDVYRYDTLKKAVKKSMGQSDRMKNSLHNVKEFLEKYSLTPEGDVAEYLEGVWDNYKKYIGCMEIYDQKCAFLNEFEQQQDMESLKNCDFAKQPTIEMLSAQMKELSEREGLIREKTVGIKRKQCELEEGFSHLCDLKNDLERLENRKSELEKEYSLIGTTKDYLTKAKDNVIADIMEPLNNSFNKYYSIITGMPADAYRVDGNLNVVVNEKGLQRESRFFSAGLKDLMGFCLRISFVDAMYQNEKPTLVFDDPFVNFDTEKIQGARKLLLELQKNYQILYFTSSDYLEL